MKLYTQKEKMLIALVYVLVGVVLVMALTSCTYIDVYTHDITIQGTIGR